MFDSEESLGQRSPDMMVERRRAGEGRRVKDAALASMINGVATADLDGRLTYVNSSFLRMWGYDSEAQVLGRSFVEFWQNREDAASVLRALCARGNWAGESVGRRRDGTAIHIQVSASMIASDEGRPVHMVGSFIDVTERRLMEEALGRSEEKLGVYLEQSPDAIYVTDLSGTLLYGNRAAEKVTGHPREEFVGKSLLQLGILPPESLARVARTLELNAGGGATGPDEVEIVRRDGSRASVEVTTYPIAGAEGTEVIGIARDITERKDTERMLREKNEQLDARNEELQLQRQELLVQREELREKTVQLEETGRHKSEFLAKMSHELRTPLNAVIGISELMLDGVPGQVNEEQRQCLADILDSGRHLLGLINDVPDLSKVEAGRMEFRPEDVAIPEVVASVVHSVRPMLQERRHRLTVDIEEGLPPVHADEGRLRQVLLNLVENAIKFTPPGGELSIEADRRAALCQVSVTDNGLGIREEDQTRIFEAFAQGDGLTQGEREGTGLGLTLSRQLVEMMGGHVWVESTLGQGSAFRFTLPLAREGESGLAAGESACMVGKARILVVDDDHMARGLIRTWLEKEGYAVVEASSGDEGVCHATEMRPDAIVLGILMPRKDGWRVLRQLKSMPATKNIPVVIISVVEGEERGFTPGVVDYFVKPVDRQAFLGRIAEVGLVPAEKVLMVDDSAADVRLVASIFESEGLEVLRARGGSEALRLARRHRPALIVLDLKMPDHSGFEVIDSLRQDEKTRDIPIIVLTMEELGGEEFMTFMEKTTSVMGKAVLRRQDFLSEVRKALAAVGNRF